MFSRFLIINFIAINYINCELFNHNKLSLNDKLLFSARFRSYDKNIYGFKVDHSKENIFKQSNRKYNEIQFQLDTNSNKMFDVDNSANYLDASSQINPFFIVILSLLYGSISFLCIVGNGLVIYSVSKNEKIKNVTKYFINNLAISDMIIGFLVSPFQVKYPFSFNLFI
jgi:hypothetical protein